MKVPSIIRTGHVLGRHTRTPGIYGFIQEQLRYQQHRAYGNTFGAEIDHVGVVISNYVWESTTSRGVQPTPLARWFGHICESRGEYVVVADPQVSVPQGRAAMTAEVRTHRGADYGYLDVGRLWSIYGKPPWLRRIAWWLAYYTHPSTKRSQHCSELVVRGLAASGLPVPRLWYRQPDLVSPARLLHWGWVTGWMPVVWTSDKCPYTRLITNIFSNYVWESTLDSGAAR